MQSEALINYTAIEPKKTSKRAITIMWGVTLILGLGTLTIGGAMIFGVQARTTAEAILWCGIIGLGAVGIIILHEALHYLAFKVCGANPRFKFVKVRGFGWCPAVAINNSVCSKGEYIFVGLVPQVVSIACMLSGVLLGLQGNVYVGEYVYVLGCFNLIGGIGDYEAVYRVLRAPMGSVFGDVGDKVCIFVPKREGA